MRLMEETVSGVTCWVSAGDGFVRSAVAGAETALSPSEVVSIVLEDDSGARADVEGMSGPMAA